MNSVSDSTAIPRRQPYPMGLFAWLAPGRRRLRARTRSRWLAKTCRFIAGSVPAALLLAGCTTYPVGNRQAVSDCPACAAGTVGLPLLPGALSYPIVEVAINGRPGYRFLFDTGAMGTLIFRLS